MTIAINLANYGDISDVLTLTSKIRLWLDRTDLDDYIPTFISLTEAYLNRELRTPDMEAVVPIAYTGNSFPLPSDFLAMRALTANGMPLDAVSPNALLTDFNGLSGCPSVYAITARTVTVAPTPLATSLPAITLSYWQRIPALSTGSPYNWLLTSNPDVYLYGALAQAEGYIENPDRAAQWASLFEGSVESLKVAANKSRYGGPIIARSGVRQVCGVRA